MVLTAFPLFRPLPRLMHSAPRMLIPPAPEALASLPALVLSAADGGGLSATADALAGSLFGASLLPWLAMLYWLSRPSVDAPPGVAFGLTFLLAFVFGSIPAAIGAGALFGVSLADADWLHGAAESLLAVTNCVVVLGFRDALGAVARGGSQAEERGMARLRSAAAVLAALAALSAFAVLGSGGASVHTPWLGGVGNLPSELWPAEPANALSLPTWLIHTSSLVEWLVAMGLAWRLADSTGQQRWKGVTWGMLPLHTSGIIACVYHLFYNDPALDWCVAHSRSLASAAYTAAITWAQAPSTPGYHAPYTPHGQGPRHPQVAFRLPNTIHPDTCMALATHPVTHTTHSSPGGGPPPTTHAPRCVALQAGMTCVGNTTLALACLRLALATGWTWGQGSSDARAALASALTLIGAGGNCSAAAMIGSGGAGSATAVGGAATLSAVTAGAAGAPGGSSREAQATPQAVSLPSASLQPTLLRPASLRQLLGWEDLGDTWAADADLPFLAKLMGLAAALAYLVK